MNVGVTGTRDGMTEKQKDAFWDFVFELENVTSFHHGDCVGVDDEAASIVAEMLGDDIIVCHPPSDENHRAFNDRASKVLPAKRYLTRNRDIVDACDLLIVCPLQMKRQKKSGTWFTHDYAVKQKKKVVVIWPDGTKKEVRRASFKEIS